MPFRDPETAARARERIEALVGGPFPALAGAEAAADPDRAVTNLERWLLALPNPAVAADALSAAPILATPLFQILGASEPLADALVRNPEMASLLLDPAEATRRPTVAGVVAEGGRLLAAATSHTHALDRLRYLRHRWTLPILLNDLAGTWPQEKVWGALSDVADAVVTLARDVVWREHALRRGLDGPCPLSVVAFGKLGGREVNYSSDLDLAYVLDDDADERMEREATRYAEAFGRALSDRMGRGMLYRVDLRLRPYGGTGAILRRMISYEGYYLRYAEAWEVQALLRTRVVAGTPGLAERWEAMRTERVFRPRLPETAVEEMVAQRTRIEENAGEDDLKRGRGGIRDVEFLAQILQMAFGHRSPELRRPGTLDALRALTPDHLSPRAAEALVEGYTFLRRLEHRVQTVGDLQTHTLPADPALRRTIARMMGEPDEAALDRSLRARRRTISAVVRSTLHPREAAPDARERTLAAFGPEAPSAERWLDPLPETYWDALERNEGSFERARTVLRRAPRLAEILRERVGTTERVFSGEIEEPADPFARLDSPSDRLAVAYVSGRADALARYALDGDADALTATLHEGLSRLVSRLVAEAGGLTAVALGSLANRETGPDSDADLLLFPNGVPHPEAERAAQRLLTRVAELSRAGAPLELDLRLRPDGGKGLLVRTMDGLRAYRRDGMETWERFALGHAAPLFGDPAITDDLRGVVLHPPATPAEIEDLARMKRRIETERVAPRHVRRHLKLGPGAMADVEWTVRLGEMRHPEVARPGDLVERARNLARAGLLNALETDALAEARGWLRRLRVAVWCLGGEADVIPENPDRLARLAENLGEPGANALLSRHAEITGRVRGIFLTTLEGARR